MCDAKQFTRQQEKLSATRRVEGLMKHVPNGHERKTARDGTPGPMKERAVPTAGKVVV